MFHMFRLVIIEKFEKWEVGIKSKLRVCDGVMFLKFHPHGYECPIELPVITSGSRDKSKAWTWNGDIEKPTLRPSVKTTHSENGSISHLWLNDGVCQYLSDSTDGLAGQTHSLHDLQEEIMLMGNGSKISVGFNNKDLMRGFSKNMSSDCESYCWTLEEIKSAFWKTFHKSGELWFDDLGKNEDCVECTNSFWMEFIENLGVKGQNEY